ncbi:unnamed protein product, partial [Ranitomeya imitator]
KATEDWPALCSALICRDRKWVGGDRKWLGGASPALRAVSEASGRRLQLRGGEALPSPTWSRSGARGKRADRLPPGATTGLSGAAGEGGDTVRRRAPPDVAPHSRDGAGCPSLPSAPTGVRTRTGEEMPATLRRVRRPALPRRLREAPSPPTAEGSGTDSGAERGLCPPIGAGPNDGPQGAGAPEGLGAKWEESAIYDKGQLRMGVALWRRFIDDVILIWEGSRADLDSFICGLNINNFGLEFTPTISDSTINFLDLTIFIEDGHLRTKCYRKEVDSNSFIHTRSCHLPYKRHLCTPSNSLTPNSTMVKTKELSKDTRNKIVALHQAGKTESAIGNQLGVKKSTTSLKASVSGDERYMDLQLDSVQDLLVPFSFSSTRFSEIKGISTFPVRHLTRDISHGAIIWTFPVIRPFPLSVVNSVAKLPPVVESGTSAGSVYELPLVDESGTAASEFPSSACNIGFSCLLEALRRRVSTSVPEPGFVIALKSGKFHPGADVDEPPKCFQLSVKYRNKNALTTVLVFPNAHDTYPTHTPTTTQTLIHAQDTTHIDTTQHPLNVILRSTTGIHHPNAPHANTYTAHGHPGPPVVNTRTTYYLNQQHNPPPQRQQTLSVHHYPSSPHLPPTHYTTGPSYERPPSGKSWEDGKRRRDKDQLPDGHTPEDSAQCPVSSPQVSSLLPCRSPVSFPSSGLQSPSPCRSPVSSLQVSSLLPLFRSPVPTAGLQSPSPLQSPVSSPAGLQSPLLVSSLLPLFRSPVSSPAAIW